MDLRETNFWVLMKIFFFQALKSNCKSINLRVSCVLRFVKNDFKPKPSSPMLIKRNNVVFNLNSFP